MTLFEDETTSMLNDSVASTNKSSTKSNSISFGPVSPGWNVTSTSFETKSSLLAVPALVARLYKKILFTTNLITVSQDSC